jgi:dTDP-glucose pyrophosphorylase
VYQLSEIKIGSSTSIRKALEVIDMGAMKIALVIDENEKLIGTITDGDIRRALLKGTGMDDSISGIYNTNPVVAGIDDSKEKIIDLAISRKIFQIPLVNNLGQVVKLAEIDQLLERERHPNSVILMAGGEGRRLRPLTENTPKPMLRLGGKPILERLITSFKSKGFSNFYISLNYKGEQIKEYFGGGESLGVNIKYLEEIDKMGTAGALSLIEEQQSMPLLVMNGDILTGVDFEDLLNYHIKREASATMCIREYGMEVPFGVVGLSKSNIVSIEEKPVQQFYVNAGIYVINPEVIDYIPGDRRTDMTNVFEKLVADKKTILSYPIREYWMDIGKPEDFIKAEEDFKKYFNE